MSFADRRVEDEADAEPLDEADVHLDRLARQAEGRDADEHRAAAVRQAVEDRDLVALRRQLARDGEPGRPGADDRDPLLARRDLGHDVRDARRLVPLDEEALHRPDGERPVDVAAAAGSLARRRADVRAHRRDRVRLARQDVALLEPALGGEVQVAAAVRPDRARFLALDVALEPGGVDGLDEEFLGLVDGQAGVPFPDAQGLGRGRTIGRSADGRNLPSDSRAPCTTRWIRSAGDPGSTLADVVARRSANGRTRLTRPPLAATLAARWCREREGARTSGCGQGDRQRVQLPGPRPRPRRRQRRRSGRGPSCSAARSTRGPSDVAHDAIPRRADHPGRRRLHSSRRRTGPRRSGRSALDGSASSRRDVGSSNDRSVRPSLIRRRRP